MHNLAHAVTTVAHRSNYHWPLWRLRVGRVLASVIAALVSVAHLAVLLHFVLIQHEYCAEHRHLVHSAEYRQSRSVASARPRAPAVCTVERLDEHEHCDALAGIGKGAYLVCRAGVALRAPVLALGNSAADRSHAVLRTPVLSYAPKLSPPSV